MAKIPNHTKNIIFDLGEVFTDIYFNRTVEAFNKLAPKGEISLYSYKTQTPIFDLLETGKISRSNFIASLKKVLLPGVSENEIIAAWNAMLGDTPLDKLELANKLRPKYRTFILSNTNEIHIEWINNYLKTNYSEPNLNKFFDKVYFSHDIGYRKPDSEAYQFILDENDLRANETLFIDDKLENIEAASNLGMQAIHLTNKDDLYQIMA